MRIRELLPSALVARLARGRESLPVELIFAPAALESLPVELKFNPEAVDNLRGQKKLNRRLSRASRVRKN